MEKKKIEVNPDVAIKRLPVFYAGLIVFFTAVAIFVTNNIESPDNDLFNATALVIEVGFGIAITWTVYVYSKKWSKESKIQQKKTEDLVIDIQKLEENQKRFLDELEKTRNSRVNFYGTKLITDFKTVQKYFSNIENLSTEEFEKLDATLYNKNRSAHVITIHVDTQEIEIPNFLFFDVMKKDLQIIESDLPPEVSYFVGQTIEILEICFVPIPWKTKRNDDLWDKAKKDVVTSIERLELQITEKKSLKDYGVFFVRHNADVKNIT